MPVVMHICGSPLWLVLPHQVQLKINILQFVTYINASV